jgi:hypothetical protein
MKCNISTSRNAKIALM